MATEESPATRRPEVFIIGVSEGQYDLEQNGAHKLSACHGPVTEDGLAPHSFFCICV
ncbi:hypothetical protein C2845_PM01G46340 [Panicum miliaceum]|uniref:Uncharacterized protein n=1 Tax=Panicum miliaceum TaxID=4540 RepID=A0A3L6TQ05_PANMI|nr:hypothetical protein C2845_PM01G46340 [Panicum miliaceum]